MKRILIAGADSFIGVSMARWLAQWPQEYRVCTLDLRGEWREGDFSGCDAVFFVAGIVHIKETEQNAALYYSVNRDLALAVAQAAQAAGVGQFVYMSTMSVYGRNMGNITPATLEAPRTHYGKSKLEAERLLEELNSPSFAVALLRPPMVYGPGCKGNYAKLAKLALRLPFFPNPNNRRSMIYIDNLTEFVRLVIDDGASGLFFPQNAQYSNTGEIAASIAAAHGKKLPLTRLFNPLFKLLQKCGVQAAQKAFGTLAYDMAMSGYPKEYRVCGVRESIERTEKAPRRMLMVASVAYMILQFNLENISTLQRLGCEVDVACNFERGNPCSAEAITALRKKLTEMNVGCHQIDFVRGLRLIPNLRAYRQLLKVLRTQRYGFIHAHSPIGGALGRLAAHRMHIRAIYTAHGFHFVKGGGLTGWLILYPVERLMARYTDVLITMNQEDYQRGRTFKAGKTVYVPGIGVDIHNSPLPPEERIRIRESLGVASDELLVLSVGELSVRKNHILVLRALACCRDLPFRYVICGRGDLQENLMDTANKLGIHQRLVLPGYRNDVQRICRSADVFAFPSLREGLPVALMEAMSGALPVVGTRIRGNVDLVVEGQGGFLLESEDVTGFAEKLRLLMQDAGMRRRMGAYNEAQVKAFSVDKVQIEMKAIYSEFLR